MSETARRSVDLAGQVAVVTGGGRGLGRVMAQALVQAGARVAIVGQTEATLNETAGWLRDQGGEVVPIVADVGDNAAVERMAQRVLETYGHIDLLVNNAGTVGTQFGPFWEIDPADWQRVMDVNLNGAFRCARVIIPAMIARGRGRIINVASAAALGGFAYGHKYCVSKAALLRLTECMALDAEPHGIRVFAVDPGTVRTDMTMFLVESDEGRTYLPWFREFVLGGGAVPEALCGQLVVALASGRADALSGRFVTVHDDLNVLIDNAEQIQNGHLLTLRLGRLPS